MNTITVVLGHKESLGALVQCKNANAALLYAALFCAGGKGDIGELARGISMNENDAEEAAKLLVVYGICVDKIVAVEVQSELDNSEILELARTNFAFKSLCATYERAVGRIIRRTEMEAMFNMNTKLNMPADVLSVITAHLKETQHLSIRQLERMAYDWADRGINTYFLAEEEVEKLTQNSGKRYEIMRILGISGRQLSDTEKKHIDMWIAAHTPVELIELAYDKTIIGAGSMKWNYMSKILESWCAAGYRTKAQVQSGENGKKFQKSEKKPVSNAAILADQYAKMRETRAKKAAECLDVLRRKSAEFATVERNISRIGASIAVGALNGSADIEKATQKLETEKLAREQIIQKNGMSIDMLYPKPECEKCGDLGYIGSEMCVCFKEKLRKMK